MSDGIGETFVNYGLCKDVDEAYEAGVFKDNGIEGEDEDRHLSELERRMKALDEKEVYVTTKTFVTHHWETLKKSLKYLKAKETEGENINEQ